MKQNPTKPKASSRQKAKRKSRRRLSPQFEIVSLPHVVGKKIDEVTVSNFDDAHSVDIFFDDESGLIFDFRPDIKLLAKEIDTKDNLRDIRRWGKPKPL
jgi:hypothetical protein